MPDDKMFARLMELSKDEDGFNPGGGRVLVDLLHSYGEEAIVLVENSEVRGAEIWNLYEIVCRRNTEQVFQALKNGQAIDLLKGYRESRFYVEGHIPSPPSTDPVTTSTDLKPKCPYCGSENVKEDSFQSHDHQMGCNNCQRAGTFYEFGVDKVMNIGLVTTPEGAVLMAEGNFIDASDPSMTLAVTVHEVDGNAVGNMWLRVYDQWLKWLPERVLPGHSPNGDILVGEVNRLMFDADKMRIANSDMRWGMAVRTLHAAASAHR